MLVTVPLPPAPAGVRRVWVPAAAAEAVSQILPGAAGTGTVVAVRRRSVLIDVGGRILALVFGEGSLSPNTVQVAAARPELSTGDRVSIDGDRITVADLSIRITRRWSTQVRRVQVRPDRVTELAALIGSAPLGLPRQVVQDFARAVTDPANRRTAARAVLGLGAGSTPAGDDLLCGTMSGLIAGGGGDLAADLLAAVPDRFDRTTALSATLIGLAGAGQATLEALAVLRCLPTGDGLADAVDKLLRLGSTSGADLATGLVVGLTVACSPPSAGPVPSACPLPTGGLFRQSDDHHPQMADDSRSRLR